MRQILKLIGSKRKKKATWVNSPKICMVNDILVDGQMKVT